MKKLIESVLQGELCIDIQGGIIKNGTPIKLWEKHGGENQKWILTSDGSIVSALDNNYCIDIQGGIIKNGTPIILWEKHGGENQKWSMKRLSLK
ncbi:MAG: hypothetical protein EXR20_08560 [Bacteroidetes bacterium]|nr:hypothetical protein [Bacteroidota bacterium]